jgi:hypothetical protein
MDVKALGPGRHAVGGGLYLRVSPDGKARSWIVRLNNPETMRAIGKYPGVTLTAARSEAKKLQANGVELRQPAVPGKSKPAEPIETEDTVTMGAIWDEYAAVALSAGKWTQRHHDKTTERLQAHMSDLLDRPIASISRAEVVKACEDVESTETGQRIYRWLRGAVEHAVDTGRLTASQFGAKVPLSLSVPAADRGTLRGDLDLEGQRALLLASWQSDAAWSVRACHRAIALTGHRVTAARIAQAEYINGNVWTTPRSQMKVKDKKRGDFVIIMSGQLLEIMTEAKSRVKTGLLFKSPINPLRPISSESIEHHVGRHAKAKWSPHSWRSAQMTWAVEAGWPMAVAEAALDKQRARGATVAYDASTHTEAVSELLRAWGEVVAAKQTP